jgi:hypothetical protein
LIIEAIKTGNADSASKNLEFLIKTGLISDKDDKITTYLANNRNIPVLPSAVPIAAGIVTISIH